MQFFSEIKILTKRSFLESSKFLLERSLSFLLVLILEYERMGISEFLGFKEFERANIIYSGPNPRPALVKSLLCNS